MLINTNKILVLDQDASSIDLYEREFKENGKQIFVASDLDDAKELINKHGISFAVLDIFVKGQITTDALIELKKNFEKYQVILSPSILNDNFLNSIDKKKHVFEICPKPINEKEFKVIARDFSNEIKALAQEYEMNLTISEHKEDNIILLFDPKKKKK